MDQRRRLWSLTPTIVKTSPTGPLSRRGEGTRKDQVRRKVKGGTKKRDPLPQTRLLVGGVVRSSEGVSLEIHSLVGTRVTKTKPSGGRR